MIAARRSERGAVAVLVALLSIVMFAMAAIAVDLSNTFVRKRDVQRQADFAALAGGSELGNQTSGAVPASVVDAVRDQLNGDSVVSNLPQDDETGGATPVTSSDLTDTDLTNGQVRFANGGLQVLAPEVTVDFSFSPVVQGLLGSAPEDLEEETKVIADATVGVFSPGTGVMPVYAVSGCDFGNQTITDPASGLVTDPPIPTLAHDTDTNETTLEDLTPREVAKDASGVSVTLKGKDFEDATKVGFFRGDDADPALVVEQNTFSSPSPLPAGGYDKAGNGSMTFVIPDAVTTEETAWYVRVFQAGSVNKWSARDEAQPLRVGDAVLECDSGSTDGNFGTLKLPRNNPGPDSSWIPVNMAVGLEAPLSLAIHSTPAADGKCSGGVDGAVVSIKPDLKPGTNCSDTDTGLAANVATEGMISGYPGYSGRLVATSSSTSEGGGCAPDGSDDPRTVTVSSSYDINNDVLTCFLTDGSTSLADIVSPSYSGGPVLSSDIYSSPRFFWQPVLDVDPASGGSGYYSIVDFRPAFLTDEIVAASTIRGTHTATMENGLKVETNKVKQMKVIFFNADALSPDDSGVVVTPYLGVGPRILRLID
jgi:Flp pilus assembly protein TadG